MYIHMNVKNSKNKNNNLQKPLPNTVTNFYFYLFIYLDCVFFSSFSFYVSSNFFELTKISLIYVNIKPDKKTLHTFCFEGTPRTKINARDCNIIPNIYIYIYIYIKYDIGMKVELRL